MLQGLRTVIYKAPDLERAKRWYSETFGIEPYFNEPFYVGFNVGGFELGLDPDVGKQASGAGGSVAYWGVTDLAKVLDSLKSRDVKMVAPLQEVGEGIKVATVQDPFGNLIGLIENPHFKLP